MSRLDAKNPGRPGRYPLHRSETKGAGSPPVCSTLLTRKKIAGHIRLST